MDNPANWMIEILMAVVAAAYDLFAFGIWLVKLAIFGKPK